MPTTGPAYAIFGTIKVSRGFDFTWQVGTRPSVCMLNCLPQASTFSKVATLSLIETNGNSIDFPECRLTEPRGSASPTSATSWSVPIYDRRWKWQYGNVYGEYNKRLPDGSYHNEATVEELLRILFKVIGEDTVELHLPAGAYELRPQKRWVGQQAAAEIEQLCAEMSCVPTLNPITNTAEVWEVGRGGSIPQKPTAGYSLAPTAPLSPRYMRAVSGETEFQALWDTECVGQDVDGSWKPIEQLSWKPSEGWTAMGALSGFEGFGDEELTLASGRKVKKREFASSMIFKHFRVTRCNALKNGICPQEITDPEFIPQSLKHDIQMFNRLCEFYIDGEEGALVSSSPRVFARYQPQYDYMAPHHVLYEHGFGFDAQRKIVSFGEPMYRWGDDSQGLPIPADVKIECAFYAGRDGKWFRTRSDDGGEPYDTNSVSNIGGTETPVHEILIPDLHRRVIYHQESDGGLINVWGDVDQVRRILTNRVDAESYQYGLTLEAGVQNYVGLQLVSPDGLTQQVTWQGGNKRECLTIISVANRWKRLIPPHDELRRNMIATQQARFAQDAAMRAVMHAMGGPIL